MKGKLLWLVIVFVLGIFFHYLNANHIMKYTILNNQLEKSYQAEKNINTELRIEHDDLMSGNSINSIVPVEMSKYVPKEKSGNVIYIQEPVHQKTPTYYCIIDLFTPKAEATTNLQLD